MNRDSIKNTFIVSGLLCIICSVLVSAAAVGLKHKQILNQELDQKKKILQVCGITFTSESIDTLFSDNIHRKLVDLRTGEYVLKTENGNLTVDTYHLDKVLQTDTTVLDIDPAGLGGIRENHAVVFLYAKKNQVIIPIRGRGLWSTLYGYIALAEDASTISGITFYQHKETPGLGGEVDNPNWKAQWPGKAAIEDGQVVIEVKKQGKVTDSRFQIDGMAGATITTQGVHRLVRFWLGEQGFGKYLTRPNKIQTTTQKQ
ncbi:MAG: Na(+)-translocating NADH-quinone reductase subunit C [Planctomycetota bacterium]|nr:Na(+)-translocating NADH-quinone reductase subunit C [Planctomycetota bacterium]